jgi:hypothetical protein
MKKHPILLAALALASHALASMHTVDLIRFRKDLDRYAVYDFGTINSGALEIVMNKKHIRFTPHPYVPGENFKGPESVEVVTDKAPSNAVMVLKIKDPATKKIFEFSEKWGVKTVFATRLDATREYSFHSIEFDDPQYSAYFRFRVKSVKGTVTTPDSGALSLKVDTSSPLHVVDWPILAAPAAVVSNLSACAQTLVGYLAVEDYFGRSFKIPFSRTIPPYGSARATIPKGKGALDAKGVWNVCARLKGKDGVESEHKTSFAVLDVHEASPKRKYGEFRWGIHMHVSRHMPALQPVTLDAAVRMGAKIVRIDGIFSGFSIWNNSKKEYDWSRADDMLAELEKRGLAVNALVSENLGKYATPEFYRQLAERYGERIDYYEIGNEWDLLPKERLTPEAAVEMQKTAYRSLKAGNPKARVITNGWAVEDSDGHANVTQKGFQEYFMRNAKGYYDLHAMHLHFRFEDYVRRLGRFFEMRKREGVDAPWLLNETALSVQYRGQREVAENVWKKILYAWSKGAKDYVWYAQRASAPDPLGVWGMTTYDYRPRLHYASFSAFSAVFGGCRAIKTLVEKNARYVYGLRDAANGNIVIAGWDAAALEPKTVRIATDAKRVYLADIMNNVRELKVERGGVFWELSQPPSAVVFEGATYARPDKRELENAAVYSPRIIFVEKVRPGYGWDMRMSEYAQAHELYPADPATAHRTWKGEDDLSGILLFTTDGKKAKVKVSVKDETFVPDSDRIEIWRDGEDITGKLKFSRVRHGDNRTVYLADWPYTNPGRVNVRLIDDDGNGGIDGWMDYEPFDAKNPAFENWPIIRFD